MHFLLQNQSCQIKLSALWKEASQHLMQDPEGSVKLLEIVIKSQIWTLHHTVNIILALQGESSK